MHVPGRRGLLAGAVLAFIAVLSACASTAGDDGAAPLISLPPEIRSYVIDPTSGLEDVPGPSRSAVRDVHDRLIGGDVEGARHALASLTTVDGELLALARAQLAFAAGRPADARASLGANPRTDAGRLLSARLYDLGGQPAAAVRAYWPLRDRFAVAGDRVADLLPSAVEQRDVDFDRALAGRRHATAGEVLKDLELWAPEREETRRATVRLARATGDAAGELAAWRKLARVAPPSRPEMFDWAELELTQGDADQALEISRALIAADVADPRAAELLARAEFTWRTRLLPDRARAVLSSPLLTRSELSVALYWLFPQARYAPTDQVRIASDILEHEHREEVAQIINAGLLEVDPAGHRFRPDLTAMRSDAVAGVAEMLRRGGARCVAGAASDCAVVAACEVVAAEHCRVGDAVSGAEFAEWARRAQERLTRP